MELNAWTIRVEEKKRNVLFTFALSDFAPVC